MSQTQKFRCPSCEELAVINSKPQAFERVPGILVYCGNCKTVITWAPKPAAIEISDDSSDE